MLLARLPIIHSTLSFVLCLLFSLKWLVAASEASASSAKVLLSSIQVLTLHRGEMTTGHRTAPIEQLKCLSCMKSQMFGPSVVQCYNRGPGLDPLDVQWQCSAELDSKVRFGLIKVSCEGYDGMNDPYVLVGSCGLEYTLELKSSKVFNDLYQKDLYDTNRLSNFLTMLVLIAIIMAVYRSCKRSNEPIEPRTDINETYARVVADFASDMQGMPAQPAQNPNLFPPPPPSYGFATMHSPADTRSYKLDDSPIATPPSAAVPARQDTAGNNNDWSGFLSANSNILARRTASAETATTAPAASIVRRSESPPPAYQPAAAAAAADNNTTHS